MTWIGRGRGTALELTGNDLVLDVLSPAVKVWALTHRSVPPQRGAVPLPDPLNNVRIVIFEARHGDELATMLTRQGADVLRAPALREAPLPRSPALLELVRHVERGELELLILLTGVGTRALVAAAADVSPDFPALLERTRIVARGPKPHAALRELKVAGALPVPPPFTWREVLAVVDGLRLSPGARVAVQEYGTSNPALLEGLAERGLDVLRVALYRWALPDDTGPLVEAAAALCGGRVDVAVFTNAGQVEHLFQIAADPPALVAALHRIVVTSIGPVCSEALEAHGVPPDLEASPPKLGPLVTLLAARGAMLVAAKRGGSSA